MSDYENHVGKLVPLNKSVEQFIEDRDIQNDIWEYNEGVDGYFNEYFDGYKDNEHLVIVKGDVYKVEDKQFDPYDVLEASTCVDGVINYRVTFYNGGCGFEEALEEAINNMENE
tara:strand:+ start:398 stop:739 length:342 start_codon:yes stop_codon:yes gene_type:complete